MLKVRLEYRSHALRGNACFDPRRTLRSFRARSRYAARPVSQGSHGDRGNHLN